MILLCNQLMRRSCVGCELDGIIFFDTSQDDDAKNKQQSRRDCRRDTVEAQRIDNKNLKANKNGRCYKTRCGKVRNRFYDKDVFGINIENATDKKREVIPSAHERYGNVPRNGCVRTCEHCFTSAYKGTGRYQARVMLCRKIRGIRKTDERHE